MRKPITVVFVILAALSCILVWQRRGTPETESEFVRSRSETKDLGSSARANEKPQPIQERAGPTPIDLESPRTVVAKGANRLADAREREPSVSSPTMAESKVTASAAARTIHAAINGGDPQAMADTIVIQAQGREMVQNVYDQMTSEQKVRYRSPEGLLAELLCATTASVTQAPIITGEAVGARGMGASLENDSNYVTVHALRTQPDGTTREGVQVFQRTPDGWRWVVSDGLVLKRLVETGLMKPPASPPNKG